MPDRILRLLLSPVLVAQALRVRAQARRLPEPEGARSGITGEGPALSVLITGDSSAAGVGTDTQSQALTGQLVERLACHYRVTWRLEATTGHCTRDTLTRLQALPGQRFDVVVTALGVNDVTGLTSPARFRREQSALLTMLADRFGARLVLLSGVPPMQIFPALPQPLAWFLGRQSARLDRVLAQVATDHPPARHLPFDLPPDPGLSAEDGYHPNARAYGLWADTLAAQTETEMRSRP